MKKNTQHGASLRFGLAGGGFIDKKAAPDAVSDAISDDDTISLSPSVAAA
jgi:hypothetical protein